MTLKMPIVGVVLAVAMAACAPATTRGVAPAPSYVWSFEEGGAAEVGDVTLTMAGTWEQAEGAVSLDGGSGHAASVDPGPVVTTDSFTVAAWVSLPPLRLLGQHVFATVVSQEGSQAAAFFLGAAEEGRWSFGMKDADTNRPPGRTFRASAGEAVPDANRWVHLTGTYDADGGEIRLHVDGNPAAQTVFDSPWQAEGALTVGRSQANGRPSNHWPGAVADVRTFDSALDDDQIRALAEQTRPMAPPPAWPEVVDAVSALNGTYEYQMTREEATQLEEAFGPEAEAAGFPGEATVVIRFADGLWQQYFLVDDVAYLLDGRPEGDGGTYTVDGDRLVVNDLPLGNYRWTLDGDVLSLTYLDNPPDADMVRFVTERDFTRTAE